MNGRVNRRALRWAVRHGGPRLLLRLMTAAGSPVGAVLYVRDDRERTLRLLGRIRRRPLTGGAIALATARHDVTDRLLRDPSYLAGMSTSAVARKAVELGIDPAARGPLDPPSLLVTDPPDHTRYRRLVNRAFSARALADVRPEVERIAGGLLDALPAGRPVDLVREYTQRLPVAVIAHLMAIPEDMLGRFLAWSDAAVPALDLGLPYGEFRTAEEAVRETNAWLRGHFQRLRERPGEDLLSQLVRAHDDGRTLDDDELLALVQLVLAAGFVTIVDLLASGIVLLTRHRDQLDGLLAEPAGWPGAVDEILRHESPVQITARFAGREGELAGRRVPRGQAVLALLGGANRDERVFPEPDRFDVRRPNAGEHLAFSRGIHHCPGSGLARIEGEVGLRLLFERYPRLVPAGPPEPRRSAVLRGYARVPVLLEP